MIIAGLIGRSDISDCHDAAVAIIQDGRVMAALEQERISGRRHAYGEAPGLAADVLFHQLGLQPADIDAVSYAWDEDVKLDSELGRPPLSLADPSLAKKLRCGSLPDIPTYQVRHHYAHAASCFYSTDAEKAAVLVLDGQGEHESISLFDGSAERLVLLETYPIRCSLGLFYEAAAAYAGLGWDAAGQLMGLAAFGRSSSALPLSFDETDGRMQLPQAVEDTAPGGAELASRVVEAWLACFQAEMYPFRRGSGTDVLYYADFAATVQRTLEEAALNLSRRLARLTAADTLLISGGCALNGSMNQRLVRQGPFRRVAALPASNDAGAAIGAGLALHAHLVTKPRNWTAPRIDLGREFTEKETMLLLDACQVHVTKLTREMVAAHAADALAEGRIVIWFQGRDEFGPRALGYRSILGHPGRRETLGLLNELKGRAYWRPLGPSVLAERADEIFEEESVLELDRYMLRMRTVRLSWVSKIPSVVHIDRSTRPQLVERAANPLYYELIQEFAKKTGLPLVCNTSLNVSGRPIAHTPADALDVLRQAPAGTILLINSFLVAQPNTGVS